MQLHALVVEDEGPIRRFLEELCEANGFTVDSVSDGQPAYVLLSSLVGRYDIVFLDIRMPEWNGYDTLSLLEGKEGNRKYIVATTGYLDPETEQYVNGHQNIIKTLTKPFSTGSIAEILRDITINKINKPN
jgi:DNA-binding response OmpR family regulator